LITCLLSAQQPSTPREKQRVDGIWWLAANPGEQSGFVNGVSDCMTWEAHVAGYSETPEQLDDKITDFYRHHPPERALGLLKVWQKVSAGLKPVPKGGENWTNPHWYLNGNWWMQQVQTEQLGFVEGYLWCTHTQLREPHASYSQSNEFYRGRINGFVKTHPTAGNEAVAITLARFKDR
jgi:hypothetical protein